MIYEARLTIPPNTAQAAGVSFDLPVHPGTVKRVRVLFPDGSSDLAHLQIFHWRRQVWPANPDSDFAGNGSPLDFPEDYDIVDPPFVLTLYGWNDDILYPHTPTVSFAILPQRIGLLQSLANLFTGPRLLTGGK